LSEIAEESGRLGGWGREWGSNNSRVWMLSTLIYNKQNQPPPQPPKKTQTINKHKLGKSPSRYFYKVFAQQLTIEG
jgi:hypothetical protein